MANPRRAVSESELDVANSGPALLSNRFFITVGAYGVRIAFAEQNNPQKTPIFRTAVAMSIQDGISLYKVLQDVLKEVETNIEGATAAAQSPKSHD